MVQSGLATRTSTSFHFTICVYPSATAADIDFPSRKFSVCGCSSHHAHDRCYADRRDRHPLSRTRRSSPTLSAWYAPEDGVKCLQRSQYVSLRRIDTPARTSSAFVSKITSEANASLARASVHDGKLATEVTERPRCSGQRSDASRVPPGWSSSRRCTGRPGVRLAAMRMARKSSGSVGHAPLFRTRTRTDGRWVAERRRNREAPPPRCETAPWAKRRKRDAAAASTSTAEVASLRECRAPASGPAAGVVRRVMQICHAETMALSEGSDRAGSRW